MAKLKNSPLALTAINVMAYLLIIVGVAGLVFALISYTNNGLYTSQALVCAVSGFIGYVSLSGLYYIVKAACIYIEKEEGE